MWNDFKCTINNIVQTHVPSKQTTTKYTNPWTNTNIRRFIRRKQRAFSKARSTHAKRDRDIYKRLQQEAQWEIRRAHRRYMEEIVSESHTKNPKRFWTRVKGRRWWEWHLWELRRLPTQWQGKQSQYTESSVQLCVHPWTGWPAPRQGSQSIPYHAEHHCLWTWSTETSSIPELPQSIRSRWTA